MYVIKIFRSKKKRVFSVMYNSVFWVIISSKFAYSRNFIWIIDIMISTSCNHFVKSTITSTFELRKTQVILSSNIEMNLVFLWKLLLLFDNLFCKYSFFIVHLFISLKFDLDWSIRKIIIKQNMYINLFFFPRNKILFAQKTKKNVLDYIRLIFDNDHICAIIFMESRSNRYPWKSLKQWSLSTSIRFTNLYFTSRHNSTCSKHNYSFRCLSFSYSVRAACDESKFEICYSSTNRTKRATLVHQWSVHTDFKRSD